MSLVELKKALKEKKLIFGTERTLKNLKRGKISKVFLASNCKEDVKKDVKYYAGLSKAEVFQLRQSNEEVAAICKKPFLVSIVSCGK